MIKILNKAARFIVVTLLRPGELFKAQASRDDIPKTVFKFYILVFVSFSFIHLLLSGLNSNERPQYHYSSDADVPVSNTSDSWDFGRYYQYGEDIPIYVDSILPIGNSYNRELSFQRVDYYDPLFHFSSLFNSKTKDQLFKGFDHVESRFSLAKSGLLSKLQKSSGSLYMPPYRVQMNHQQQLWKLGEIVYTPEEALRINTLIRKGYGYQFYIDELPVVYTHSQMDILNNDDSYLSRRGIPLGYVDDYNRVVFNNYLSFIINYTKKPDNDKLYEKLLELTQKLNQDEGPQPEKEKQHNEPLMTEDPVLYNYKINAASAAAYSSEYSTRHGSFKASLFPPTYLSETHNTTVAFYYTVQFSERESFSRQAGFTRVYDHFNERFPTIATQTRNFIMYMVVLWVTIAAVTYPSNITNSINAKLVAVNDKNVADYHLVSSILRNHVTILGTSIVLGLSAYTFSTLVLALVFCLIFNGQPFFSFALSLALLSPILGFATSAAYNSLVEFKAPSPKLSVEEKEAESESYGQLSISFPDTSSVVLCASGVVFFTIFVTFLVLEALTSSFYVFRTLFVILLFTTTILIPGSLVGYWMVPLSESNSTDLLSAKTASNRSLQRSFYTTFIKFPMVELSSQVISFVPLAIPLFKLFTIVAYGKSYPTRELSVTLLLCLIQSAFLTASLATYRCCLVKYYFSDLESKFYFVGAPLISVSLVNILYWAIVTGSFHVFNTTGGNYLDNFEGNSFINHAIDNYNLIWFLLFLGGVCAIQVLLQIFIGGCVLYFYERPYKSRSTIY
ncbi:BA75_02145T0 [Komagataella pastoris]|uniref:Transmembrane 9 superfamily member n=1 Tax=Komagataella pastoris TaxID=4922 RepID=A0A1B2JAQ8_PICPA|nr:BA75_02145T0 [Komagataella pastoris]